MAGYIMTLSDIDSLTYCVKTGTYSTNLGTPKGNWMTYHEGTFADYLSMKPGDSIYFFIKRKIYGIGKLIEIHSECMFLNYIGADRPVDYSKKNYKKLEPLLDEGTANNRCLCVFEPSPLFFLDGVDMDDALNSNPDRFRMLRAMWKVSFIKVDDDENQALMDIILKRNEEDLLLNKNAYPFSKVLHNQIRDKNTEQYKLTADNILMSCAKGSKINHEMAIEAALCEILSGDNSTPMGKWDYISHQVVASPFKAIEYMDKMDIFGYRYIPGYKTKSRYLVVEIKKGEAADDVIGQIMKYVDWIQGEYAYGDYSMIEAYVVASGFSDSVRQKRDRECVRHYTKGCRPAIPCIWSSVKLVEYEFIDNKLSLKEV